MLRSSELNKKIKAKETYFNESCIHVSCAVILYSRVLRLFDVIFFSSFTQPVVVCLLIWNKL